MTVQLRHLTRLHDGPYDVGGQEHRSKRFNSIHCLTVLLRNVIVLIELVWPLGMIMELVTPQCARNTWYISVEFRTVWLGCRAHCEKDEAIVNCTKVSDLVESIIKAFRKLLLGVYLTQIF